MRKTLTSVFEFEELTEATVEAAWQADRGQLLAIHRCLEYAIGAAPDAVAQHVIRGVVWLRKWFYFLKVKGHSRSKQI